MHRLICAPGRRGLLISLLVHGAASLGYSQAATTDWQSNWAVRSGLALEIDTYGFNLPTALAFVPEPGGSPGDVLYFVTELRGTVKAVTNDRTVRIFAQDFFDLIPVLEVPEVAGEVGLAGICLAPEQGYVFVTFAYQDSDNVLRNGIVRFETDSPMFGTEPVRAKRIATVLGTDASSVSHQIGPCQVDGGRLFVSVGDGQQPNLSQNLASTLGKILRMDLDGRPLASNPYFAPGDTLEARSYVWAYGLRNPFSLKLIEGRLFAADNGLDFDRLLEVEKGENYFWDGTDLSLGSSGAVFVSPSVGPVQMDYFGGEHDALPDSLAGRFLIATAGDPAKTGPATIPGAKGVLAVGYDLRRSRATGPPEVLLSYRGDGYQSIVGLAVGSDGLYLAPLFPDEAGQTPILKLVRAASGDWPWTTQASRPPELMMRHLGCLGCHALTASSHLRPAPLLQRDSLRARLRERLFSAAYLQRLAVLDSLNLEPYASSRGKRDAIRDASGEERLRRWVYHQILEPRFDDRSTGMPALGVSESEAASLRDYLLGDEPSGEEAAAVERPSDDLGFIHAVLSKLRKLGLLPELRYRHIPIAFALGIIAGAFGYWLRSRRDNRHSTKTF